MTEMCKHGYTWGTCPHECEPTTAVGPVIRDNIIGEGLLPAPETEEKLKCVICGKDVEAGKVYKGKPICNECMSGLSMAKAGIEQKPEVPQVTEEIVKKFPTGGEK